MNLNGMALASLAVAALGCKGGKFDPSFPEAASPEAVSISWPDGDVTGTWPSVVFEGGEYHLFFTGTEGSRVGTLHASSADGVSFELSSSHRVVDNVDEVTDGTLSGSRVYNSGSTWHILANAEVDGAPALVHGRGTSPTSFSLDDSPVLEASVAPASGNPEAYEVTSALYEPTTATAWLRVPIKGDDDVGCWQTRSEDGGDTWSEPEQLFGPSDVPTPWDSDTIGPGFMGDFAVSPGVENGYHMLLAGAGASGDSGVALSHASSPDGLVWTLENDSWWTPEDGSEFAGLSLMPEGTGYRIWFALVPPGSRAPSDGVLYTMRVQ